MKKKRILEEIYDKAIEGSVYMEQMERLINKQLEVFLSVHKERLSKEEYTRLQEIVIGSSAVTEKTAFIEGFCYGLQLLKEIYLT